MVKALPSTKPKVNGSNPKDKPSAAQLAYESEESRCFYCKSLLLITDSDSFHAVCSENCPSRLAVGFEGCADCEEGVEVAAAA